jgi:hypothetical protein
MNKTQYWLPLEERLKVLLLGAGTKGGSGKSLILENIYAWYGYKFDLVPRAWDGDRMGTFAHSIGAESIFASGGAGIPLQNVFGEVLQDEEHSVFMIDTPASSEDQVRASFEKIDFEALYLHGVHIVLVVSITHEEETRSKVLPWMQFLKGCSSNLFVRNRVIEAEPVSLPVSPSEDDLVVDQGHFTPQELVGFVRGREEPLHKALLPYLRSFRRPFMEAKRRGSRTALGEWNAIRDKVWADYPAGMRNESNFMPGAMVLDRFYDQLDAFADRLLPADFQGRLPGTFELAERLGREGAVA